MPVPEYQTFMLPVLRRLSETPGSVTSILPLLRKDIGVSDEDAELLLPSGKKTVFADRAQWARTYLAKAGLLEAPKRNFHQVTAAGRALLATKPTQIDNAVLARYPGFNEWRELSKSKKPGDPEAAAPQDPPTAASALTPDEMLDKAIHEIDRSVTDDLLDRLRSGSAARFEQIVVDLLVAMGYGGGDAEMARAIGRSGDGGIDGTIREDKLGLDMVYVQAKRYAADNRVGRPAIQNFVGSLDGERASKGLFVTTSDFSREAQEYARQSTRRIVLLNGRELAQLMLRHRVGVREDRAYVRCRVDEGYFDEE